MDDEIAKPDEAILEHDGQGGPKQWLIRSIEVEARLQAVASARKAGITVGEWMARAIRNQARVDEGNAVIPPVLGEKASDTGRITELYRGSTLGELNNFLIAASTFIAQPRAGRRAVAAISALALEQVNVLRAGLPETEDVRNAKYNMTNGSQKVAIL